MSLGRVASDIAATGTVQTGIGAAICMDESKFPTEAERNECLKGLKQNAKPGDVAGIVVGAVGAELMEQGLKKALAKAMAKKAASKTAGKAGAKIGQEVAEQIAKKAAVNFATKTAAKQATAGAAKKGLLASMGPVGWAMLGFDVVSMGLDLWDPAGWGTTMWNKDIRDIRKMYLDMNRKAVEETEYPHPFEEGVKYKGKDFPKELGGPFLFPEVLYPDYPPIDPNTGMFKNDEHTEKYMEYIMQFLEENGYDYQQFQQLVEQKPRLPDEQPVSQPEAQLTAPETGESQNIFVKYRNPILISIFVFIILLGYMIFRPRD